MPKTIVKLTAEQKARFPEFTKKWIDIGLSTQPADRMRAETAIAGLYRLSKLKEPRVIWLPCPISAALSAVFYAKLIQHRLDPGKKKPVDSAVRSAVRSAVYSAVYSAVGSAVGSAVYSAVGSAGKSFFGGSIYNTGYAACADYFNEVCAIAIDRNFLEMMESCGFYWTLDGICFASERPSEIHRDGEGRLHAEFGMSIRYAGTGWGLFHWHGTQVPCEWITQRNKLTPKIALTWENIEQRRAACEILGWSRILTELNSKTIDKDGDPEIGELVEVELPQIGREKFLRVLCGTKREFALPVPPTMKTALEAQAWTWGLDKKSFVKPEVRT